MSLLDMAADDAAPIVRKRFFRPATVAVALVSVAVFVLLAWHVVDNGYLRRDVEALQAGDAWKSGGWLTQIVLRFVSLIRDTTLQQTALGLFSAVAAGLAFGALYERFRAHGWLWIGAMLVLVCVGLHMGTLYALTAQSRAIPLYIAIAALIPAIRAMEDVGDVQSTIALGLLLPLLLLATPTIAPLILPLAFASALSDPDGRRDPRAFIAMLIVALLPTIIVAVGIVGFVAQAGFDVADALLPYYNTYSSIHFGDLGASLLALMWFAPVMIVPVVYCFWPRLSGKRHVWTAFAIIAMPLYLAVVRVIINTPMTPMAPALALIAAFVSWLAVERLPMALRVFALAMLAASTAMSWFGAGFWDDPLWRAAMFNDLPAGIEQVALRPRL